MNRKHNQFIRRLSPKELDRLFRLLYRRALGHGGTQYGLDYRTLRQSRPMLADCLSLTVKLLQGER